MKKWINDLVNRYPYGPLMVFGIGGPLVCAAVYLTPTPVPLIAAIFGVFLFIQFVIFLYLYRSGQRAAIGTAAPAIIGPSFAQLYIHYRAPNLEPLLDSTGSMLIQLAFFFASLLGAVVYVFVMFGENRALHKVKIRTCFILLLFVFCIPMMFDLTDQKKGMAGPPLAFTIEAPRLTALTISRMTLAFLSVVVATWPQSIRRKAKSQQVPLK